MVNYIDRYFLSVPQMEGDMASNKNAKVTASTFLKTGDHETRIEKIHLDAGQEKIRLSCSKGNEISAQLNLLSESELLELLYQAIQSGVLPRNFIGKLRERIEI